MHPSTVINPAIWQVRRLIAFGYIDGPTEGIIDLGRDLGSYCFKVTAMDLERELRAVVLMRLPDERFEVLAEMLSAAFGPPKWPVWVPRWDPQKIQSDIEAQISANCSSEATV